MDKTLIFCWCLLGAGVACFLVCVGIGIVLAVTHYMAAPPEGHDIPDVVHGHGCDFYPEVEDVDLEAGTNIDLPDVLPAHGTAVDDDTGEWLALNQGRVELPENDKE